MVRRKCLPNDTSEQRSPANPNWQMQRKVLPWFTQRPPFKHGLTLQWSSAREEKEMLAKINHREINRCSRPQVISHDLCMRCAHCWCCFRLKLRPCTCRCWERNWKRILQRLQFLLCWSCNSQAISIHVVGGCLSVSPSDWGWPSACVLQNVCRGVSVNSIAGGWHLLGDKIPCQRPTSTHSFGREIESCFLESIRFLFFAEWSAKKQSWSFGRSHLIANCKQWSWCYMYDVVIHSPSTSMGDTGGCTWIRVKDHDETYQELPLSLPAQKQENQPKLTVYMSKGAFHDETTAVSSKEEILCCHQTDWDQCKGIYQSLQGHTL